MQSYCIVYFKIVLGTNRVDSHPTMHRIVWTLKCKAYTECTVFFALIKKVHTKEHHKIGEEGEGCMLCKVSIVCTLTLTQSHTECTPGPCA
jgi:hypothetical protein